MEYFKSLFVLIHGNIHSLQQVHDVPEVRRRLVLCFAILEFAVLPDKVATFLSLPAFDKTKLSDLVHTALVSKNYEVCMVI